MRSERIVGRGWGPPFPVYAGLADFLASAHTAPTLERDPTVAHVLGTCAGYAYGGAETVSTIMARLGLEDHACVRITETVDAMLIFSTAYLVQSRCGRVVILAYRGTEPTNLGNWLGDVDVGPGSSLLSLEGGARRVRVHAGFYRNVRATFPDVVRELAAAAEGRSLADHDRTVDNGLEALYVTGHSLGGAMALLFGLMLSDGAMHRHLAGRLRALYTFGQPLALDAAPGLLPALESKVFRHVITGDPIPVLPPASWARLTHIGREYRYAGDEWRRAEVPSDQMRSARAIPQLILGGLGPARRSASRWSFREHAPHRYLAALRPAGRVTEFGD